MKIILLLTICLFLGACSHLPNWDQQVKWTNEEKILFGSGITFQLIDTAQTYKGLNNGMTDVNPTIKDVQSLIITKVISNAIIIPAAHYSDHKWRKRILWFWNLVGGGCVYFNYKALKK